MNTKDTKRLIANETIQEQYYNKAEASALKGLEYDNKKKTPKAITCYSASYEILSFMMSTSVHDNLGAEIQQKVAKLYRLVTKRLDELRSQGFLSVYSGVMIGEVKCDSAEIYSDVLEEVTKIETSTKVNAPTTPSRTPTKPSTPLNTKGTKSANSKDVMLSDVIGLDSIKQALQEAVFLPLRFPSLFKDTVDPWKGILLYGPPGTGKSFLARALANESECAFYSVNASDILGKYVGESEKSIAALFSVARKNSPAIIFIDEIDSLMSARSDNENEATRRVKTTFLTAMEGIGTAEQKILVLGATNTPWDLDPAARRRFEKRFYVPLPNTEDRASIISKKISKFENSLVQRDVDKLASATMNFSGADLNILCRGASMQRVRRLQKSTHFVKNGEQYTPCSPSTPNAIEMSYLSLNDGQVKLEPVSYNDFVETLKTTKASSNNSDLKRFIDWTAQYGSQ